MNAGLKVLPKVWGCAETNVAGLRLVKTCGARAEFAPGARKGPQRLELVSAGFGGRRGPGLELLASGRAQRGAEAPRLSPAGQEAAQPAWAGRLHLVRASAAAAVANDPTMAADGPIALRRQATEVQGVGYEFYRKYTEALLRRYMTMSFENGRVPTVLGRELFRGQSSSFTINSFEDVSNFVHDVGRCLQTLDAGQQHLLRRIALEEYTQEETAAMLGMSLRTVIRRYREAVDRLTRVLLERGMMRPLERGADDAGAR